MQTYCKGSPFRFLPFLRNLQNRKTPKGPPFNFFSALCEFFFENFYCLKSVPPSDFLIFCNRKYVNESQRVPLFHFSALCDVFEVFFRNNSKKFKKISIFFVSSREKWFSSHIEHERHTLGVSKVFSKLFMNTSWAYLEKFALFEP